MRRRNWFVILSIASAAGYAAFGLWGGVFGPVAALVAVVLLDRRSGSKSAQSEEERFAAFMQSATTNAAPPVSQPPGPVVVPDSEHAIGDTPKLAREMVASKALMLAARSGDSALVIGLFEEFAQIQGSFTLDAATWAKLGTLLLKQGAFLEAGQALHAGALVSGDAAAAQKRLAEVAGMAAKAGAELAAVTLYRALADKYPDAGLANFASARAEELHKRIAATS